MALSFNEQHAMSLVLPHLAPGETVLFRARGVERPWWTALFFRLGFVFWRNYLLAVTHQRLLLIRHKGLLGGYGEKQFESVSWQELENCKLGWGIFRKNLTLLGHGKRWHHTIQLHRFQMKGNFDAAQGLVQTWQMARGLPPGAPPAYALQGRHAA
jgi:hypothetical protein